jgi:hypothetical protein
VQFQCLQHVPNEGLQKRATFSTLIVGLAGTRNQTRATRVAGSGTNRSAIHYNKVHKNMHDEWALTQTFSLNRAYKLWIQHESATHPNCNFARSYLNKGTE